MNYGDRLAYYQDRGFRPDAAAINVFIGGASLVLFYGSQRHSADLDLWLNSAQAPRHEDIIAVLQPNLTEAAEALGYSTLSIQTATPLGEVVKFSVTSGGNLLFTIDLTKMGAVIKSEVTSLLLATAHESISIPVPTRNLALFSKAEAFLTRRRLKARDAFDIKLLLDSGAELTDSLKIHLVDGPAADRLEDPAYITGRISQVDVRICKPELEPFLPEEMYRELEANDFELLRDAVTALFSEWLR
jgi:hypothetical protein